MKIKSITLINWQRHANLHLDFNDDLNIISGKSEAGKSCIRRAFAWILFNANISEKSYRREGTDETSVKVCLDNDFEIERIRSNSINRYILRHKDFEDKVFDSFGKTIPEEIQQIINVSEIDADNDSVNLNVAEQLSLPFLLDKSATFRSKLFNKLTGNEILDTTFKRLNKEHLRVKREITETEGNLAKQEEQLSDYSIQYKESKKKLNLVKTKYEDLLEQIDIYENLKDLSEKIKTNKENREFIEFKKAQIKTISENKIKELKEKATLLEKYKTLFSEIESIKDIIKKLEEKKSSIKIVDVDLKDLKSKDESLQKLIRLNDLIALNIEKGQTLALDEKVIVDKLKENESQLAEIWKDCPQCPLCKQEMKNG